MWAQVLESTAPGAHWCQQLVPKHSKVSQGQVSSGQGEGRGLHRLLLYWRLQQCSGALLETDADVCFYISPETWLLCFSTFAKAECLVDLGKGVRLRNRMKE